MMTVVLESALRTAITVGLVWVTLKLFRVTHVVSQKIAWSLVLIAALAMPSVMRWHAFRVSLPTALRSYSTMRPSTKAAVLPQVRTIEGTTSNSVRRAIKSPDTRSSPGPRMAKLNRSTASVYLTICAILLLRLLLGLTWAFRVWRRARPVFALSTTVMKVRSSGDISTPLTIGFCVVLPLPFENWDRAKLQMVLAHERSHIRQADFFLQLLARLHAVIFWFSPLAWWLQKELAGLGEAISDQAAIMQAPDRCSYAELLLEFAGRYRRPLAGIPMTRRGGINRRVERILNDTLFRCAFMGRKRHVFVAVAFSVALLLSTSQFVVRAASRVSGPTPLAGQGIVQETSIDLPTAESSEASVANPHIELLTQVAESEQTAAMQRAELIQQRAKDAWTKAMPKGMNSGALLVTPKTLSQSYTAIEFSVASNGYISDLVLVHASGQVSLDRMAWGALTRMDGPHTVPGLPNRKLRYRITFAYDNRVADRFKSGERPAVADADLNTNNEVNLWRPEDATQTLLSPDSLVHVRTLTIISSNLPEAERLRITRAVEGRTYRVDMLEVSVLRNLGDLGYAKATGEEPHLSGIALETPPPRSANVSIQVSPGKQYRLEAVIFEGGHSFSSEQLRDALHFPVGGLFNATAIGNGLERLRQLYATNGHVNFAAVPTLQVEEDRSAVVLRVNIDEGDVFNFGRLFFEGRETRAGEANALLNAWTRLSGKRYNGQLLSKWLVENATFLPLDARAQLRHLEMHQDISTHRVDILLKFP
jgi:beta-lactamase regulating signal transducer with metallopeptidase domain